MHFQKLLDLVDIFVCGVMNGRSRQHYLEGTLTSEN